jgi:hypothetical protein
MGWFEEIARLAATRSGALGIKALRYRVAANQNAPLARRG